MSTKKKKTPTMPFDPGTFYQAPVKVNGDKVTIELPLKAAEYFELDGPVVYWAPVGGVIQLSGKQPIMVIPMLCANSGQFVPQKAADDAQEQPTLGANLNRTLDHLAHIMPAGNVTNVRPARRQRRPATTTLPRAPMPATPVANWVDWLGEEPERQ